MSWNIKLSVFLLGFCFIIFGVMAGCNAMIFKSSETTDQILNKIIASINMYHKEHNKFPDFLTDIDKFPYEIKPDQRCTHEFCRSYDIRNLDGSYINGKHYLKLRYSVPSKRMESDFVRSLSLDHKNLTCFYYLRSDRSYTKSCRPTDPSGFRQ